MGSALQNTGRALEKRIDLLDRVDYRLAETDADREAIYRLRYRAYLSEGAIEPRKDHRLTDRFDDAPNSWTFGIYVDGSLASSLRISVASPENPDTPAVDAFGDLLEPELAQGQNHCRSEPLCRGSISRESYSRTSLCDAAAGLCGVRLFQRGSSGRRRSARSIRLFIGGSLCIRRCARPGLIRAWSSR